MRKSLALAAIISCIIFSSVKAQYVNIPDTLFRNYLRENYPTCMNAQGQLDTTCNGILSVGGLTLSNAPGGICFRDLTGLQYFKNLTFLWLFNQFCLETMPVINSLKELWAPYSPVKLSWLPNGLKVFNITNQDAVSINEYPPFINDNGHLPDSLVTLDCTYQISMAPTGGFPPFPQGLRNLYIHPVQPFTVDSLPALPTSLKRLNIGNLELRRFPVLPQSLSYLNWSSDFGRPGLPLPALPRLLDTFDLFGRMIKDLPAMPGSLKYFACWGNQDSTTTIPIMPNGLKTFRFYVAHSLHSFPPLPNSIVEMDCWEVFLDSLPALPTSLKKLVFDLDPRLTSIPALPAGLQYLECNSNNLTSLPVLHDGLITVSCSNNRIQQIQRIPNTIETLDIRANNIYCLPLIPQTPYHTTIKADATIKCVSNVNTNLSYYQGNASTSSIPKLCTPTNNERRCSPYPVIKGYLFYDANNNGIKDPGENGKKDVKVTLTTRNNNFTFSDKNGYYEIQADTIGAFTVTPETWSPLFDFVPANAGFNFTRYDTVAHQDFTIHPIIAADGVSVNITCLSRLRPGFPAIYNISYENTGSTTLVNPLLTVHFDNTKLTFDSSNAGMVQNGNDLTVNTPGILPIGQGSITVWFRVKPTTVIGDSIIARATIAANTATATDYSREIVRGAVDPNDKNATPELSPLQVINGDYIDYTIRFQNTGTDTAFNIVISDTLNSDLQPATLKMVTASHNCKTTVQGNRVYFEFLDILLPDSNVNEPASHGFVSFKIKPQPTVAVNTTIPNKAAIYFDYNAPVITNTAGTLIKNFVVVPLKLISFSAVPQNDNTTSLSWNTSYEINTKQFIIERSNDGIRFNDVVSVVAKGRANNTYNASVADVNTGIIFYRSKIVDNDGSFTYSPVIKIDRRKNAAGISILTNPVRNILVINISGRRLNGTNATIINMQGAVAKTFIIKEGNQTIDLRNLPSGIYYLQYTGGSQKIIVQ